MRITRVPIWSAAAERSADAALDWAGKHSLMSRYTIQIFKLTPSDKQRVVHTKTGRIRDEFEVGGRVVDSWPGQSAVAASLCRRTPNWLLSSGAAIPISLECSNSRSVQYDSLFEKGRLVNRKDRPAFVMISPQNQASFMQALAANDKGLKLRGNHFVRE